MKGRRIGRVNNQDCRREPFTWGSGKQNSPIKTKHNYLVVIVGFHLLFCSVWGFGFGRGDGKVSNILLEQNNSC